MLKKRLLIGALAMAIATVSMTATRSEPGLAQRESWIATANQNGLTEVAVPIVVDTVAAFESHSGHQGDAGLIAGPGQEIDPEIQEALEQHATELRADLIENGGPNLSDGFAAAGGGMAVTYNATYPAPSQVRSVVNAAVQLWSSVFALHPQGPVVIDVSWKDLGNPGLLGYAGPDGMFFGGSLPPGQLYPAALTNTLLGLDANGPSRAEVTVMLNSQLLANDRWHLATSGTVPSGKIDLYSVVLHEIGHGLGFLGSATLGAGNQPQLHSTPYGFDNQVRAGSTPIVSLSQSAAASALRSGDVHVDVSETANFELYAPNTWITGSSYSHFDEHQYPSGSPGALMTPMLGNGEAARILDAAVLGVMKQIGWPMTTSAVTPTIQSIIPAMTSVTVSWDRNLWKLGLTPDQYRVEAWRGTTKASQTTVNASASSAVVGSLAAATNYTIRVIPIVDGFDGAVASGSVTTSAGFEPVNPSQWPDYIQNSTLHGEVNRLYQAYFLRLPDRSGFEYWLGERISGRSLSQLSGAFAASAEFSQRYGSLSDQAFVDLVYANVMNRAGDAEGRAFWLQRLADGLSRGDMMLGFAESSEYTRRTGTAAAISTEQAKVTRLYQAFFGRSPDSSGLNHWSSVHAGGSSLESIADSFVQSSEFATTYGSLSDNDFINLVYTRVLQRPADSAGLNFWLGRLASGSTRGEVMVQFSESAEFIRRTGTPP